MTTATGTGTGTATGQQVPRVAIRSVVAGVIEVAASLTAWLAMGGLLSNKLDSSVAFFGESPEVHPVHVTAYHHWLLVLGLAVLVTFVASGSRRGHSRGRGGAHAWHGFVLLAAALSAALFHVSLPTAVEHSPLQHHQEGPVCYSGGDSAECVGG